MLKNGGAYVWKYFQIGFASTYSIVDDDRIPHHSTTHNSKILTLGFGRGRAVGQLYKTKHHQTKHYNQNTHRKRHPGGKKRMAKSQYRGQIDGKALSGVIFRFELS